MTKYMTRAGDTADFIAWKHYGTTERKVVEKLLDANKGLSDMGPVLPAGVIVLLPAMDTTVKAKGIKLWD